MVKPIRKFVILVVATAMAAASPPASAEDQDSPVEHEAVELAPATTPAPGNGHDDLPRVQGETASPLPTTLRFQAADEEDDSPGIPSPVVFQDGFDSLSLWGGRSPSSRNKVELTPAGFDGAGLRVNIPRGSHFGADFKLDLSKTLGDDPDNLFFRYYLRLDPDWATTSAGKLPGFSGVYSSTGLGGYPSRPTAPGWSSRMAFFPSRNGDPRAKIGYYVYHLGQEERYGDSMRWNETGKLVPGEWYCLEGEIQVNSLGRANGKLRGWVDGNPAFNAAGLEFRRPNEPNIRIESFWFNVYYGGKSVPPNNLGLTVDSVAVGSDRVGCDLGAGPSRTVDGDTNGDGFNDRVSWSPCPDGSCLRVRTTTVARGPATTLAGDGAWFSLQSHRVGMASGDLDGDGRDELIYRGRCDASVKCWRVHQFVGSTVTLAEDWGGGSWFAPSASTLVLGDWDGDGLEDLAYQGRCVGANSGCWRVHRSLGDGFAPPENWGPPPGESVLPIATDITGDGFDDLVYAAPCGKGTCWFAQASNAWKFGERVKLGPAMQHEIEDGDFIDFNGDGLDDLVSVRPLDQVSRIEVRLMQDEGLTEPVLVAVVDGIDAEVQLRRVSGLGRTEAIVKTDCQKRAPCLQHLAATWSMQLLPMHEYRQLRLRLGELRAV